MDHTNDGSETELYLMRIWKARSGEGAGGRRLHGRVQHVVSGEAYTFLGYHGLAEAIEKMIAERESDRRHRSSE